MDETNTINTDHPPSNTRAGMETMQTRQIAIEGMTCDHCVKTVEHALSRERGVKEVRVDLKQAIATVTFDTSQTDIPALHDALLKAGYHPTSRAKAG